jgi:hypothetical protein
VPLLTSTLAILSSQWAWPREDCVVGRQQDGLLDQGCRDDKAIERITRQIFQIRRPYGDVCRQFYFANPERQDART